MDGISVLFILLNSFMTLLVVISAWRVIESRVAQYMTAFLIMAGMVNGVFSALAPTVWLPSVQEEDSFTAGASSMRRFSGAPGWGRTRVVAPDWLLVVVSGAPVIWIVYKRRRRRAANLCQHCEYALVGLKAGADGLLTCPECGHRSVPQ